MAGMRLVGIANCANYDKLNAYSHHDGKGNNWPQREVVMKESRDMSIQFRAMVDPELGTPGTPPKNVHAIGPLGEK